MGLLLEFIGLVLGVLALIGLFRGKAPVVPFKGRPAFAGLMVAAWALLALGSALLPKSDVVLSVTPATALVKVNGEVYRTFPAKLKLTDLAYTVEASAEGYKPQSLQWDTRQQKRLDIALVKKTASELAQEKAAAAKQAQAEAAALAPTPAPAQAEQSGLDDGTFAVKCEDAARQQLKSPSTAKFPSASEEIGAVQNFEGGKKSWMGWVDSQNSFGATIRTEFLCTFEPAKQDVEVALYQ